MWTTGVPAVTWPWRPYVKPPASYGPVKRPWLVSSPGKSLPSDTCLYMVDWSTSPLFSIRKNGGCFGRRSFGKRIWDDLAGVFLMVDVLSEIRRPMAKCSQTAALWLGQIANCKCSLDLVRFLIVDWLQYEMAKSDLILGLISSDFPTSCWCELLILCLVSEGLQCAFGQNREVFSGDAFNMFGRKKT